MEEIERIEGIDNGVSSQKLKWVSRDELLDFPYGAFKLGLAPDGLDWAFILKGREEHPLTGYINSIDKLIIDEIGEKSERVSKLREVFREWEKEFFIVETKDDGKCYMHRVPIDRIFGETLFEKLYNSYLANLTRSGCSLYELYRSELSVPEDAETKQSTEYIALKSKEKTEVRLEKEVNKYLLIPLKGGDIKVAQVKKGVPISESIVNTRPAFFESITALEDKDIGDELFIDSYNRTYNSLGTWYKERIGTSDVYMMISLKKILEKFLMVVKELVEYHKRGMVHGDIKPANIIITSDGVKLIDELNVKAGDKAPALTKMFASPEAVLGEPVSPQTDVYTLGVILSHLLGATPYGEVKNYTLPIKGEGLKRFNILNCRSSYIDAELYTADVTQLSRWEELITNCLRFEQDRRIDAEKLADEVSELLTNFNSPRKISMKLSFGNIGYIYVKDLEKQPELCWLVG